MPDKNFNILLVDDSPSDVGLTQEAMRSIEAGPPRRGRTTLHVACDGAQALEFLNRQGRHAQAPRPDLILLDLNMPRKNGREVLAEIKADERLMDIPVVILTTSDSRYDASACYQLQCNCFFTKPVALDDYINVISSIEAFWRGLALLPRPENCAEIPSRTQNPTETVPAAASASKSAQLARQIQETMPQPVHYQPLDVLVIEDDSNHAGLIEHALSQTEPHHRLHLVSDGPQALAFLRRQNPFTSAPRPHYILLDLTIPGMNGNDVLTEIKTDDNLKSIPVIVFSGSNAGSDVSLSYRLHANCYVTKPYDIEQFQSMVLAIQTMWFSSVVIAALAN